MKILFFGDVFGKPGRKAVKEFLPNFKEKNQIDLCIANCENLTDGKGVSVNSIEDLAQAGVDIFSSGNHLWDRKESMDFIQKESRIAKPLNYPKAACGFDFVQKDINGTQVILLTLCGQAFMTPVDSPFHVLDDFLNTLSQDMASPPVIIVDFHAESTAEKKGFGYFFDGRITAMFGTHTHIQTADEEILENGTAYITDVGMCGAHKSVIGITIDSAFERIRTNIPVTHKTAQEGLQVNAVLIEVDNLSGKTLNIKRIKERI